MSIVLFLSFSHQLTATRFRLTVARFHLLRCSKYCSSCVYLVFIASGVLPWIFVDKNSKTWEVAPWSFVVSRINLSIIFVHLSTVSGAHCNLTAVTDLGEAVSVFRTTGEARICWFLFPMAIFIIELSVASFFPFGDNLVRLFDITFLLRLIPFWRG